MPALKPVKCPATDAIHHRFGDDASRGIAI